MNRMNDIRVGMGYRSIYEIPIPDNVEAFLIREGVPLNTKLTPGNSGEGVVPGTSYSLAGLSLRNLSNSQKKKFLKQERLKYLYRMLKWWGYFDTPVAQRKPIPEVLGTNGNQDFTWTWMQYLNNKYRPSAPNPVHLPMEYGGELVMSKSNLTVDPINQQDFVDGEKVNVLYTKEQLKKLNEGEEVNVKASMIYRPTSVNSILERGSLVNPMTREKTELRQRRTLRLKNTNGGKRRRKQSKKSRK